MFFSPVVNSLRLSGRLSPRPPVNHRSSVSIFELHQSCFVFIIQVDFSRKAFKSFSLSTPRRFSVCRGPNKVHSSGSSKDPLLHACEASALDRAIIFRHGSLHLVHLACLVSSKVLHQGGGTFAPSGSKVCFLSVGKRVWQVKEVCCRDVTRCGDHL